MQEALISERMTAVGCTLCALYVNSSAVGSNTGGGTCMVIGKDVV